LGTSLRMKSSANAFGAAAAGSTAAKNMSSNSPECPEKQRRRKPHHYVFGYGSLMCPESRSITNPNLIKREGKHELHALVICTCFLYMFMYLCKLTSC
jgi:hypothetical protein